MIDTPTIPVISLWQPWATAVVTLDMEDFKNHFDSIVTNNHPLLPIKENETRHWSTPVRGRVLIHASKKWNKDLKRIFESWPFNQYKHIMTLHFGAIVGSVEITECISSEKWKRDNFPTTDDKILAQALMGNFADGRFIFKLQNPRLFSEPIPMKGKQTPFWKLPISELPEKYRELKQVVFTPKKLSLNGTE